MNSTTCGFVAAGLERRGPQCVGRQAGKLSVQNSLVMQGSQLRNLDLPRQLVLTTGDREDHGGPPGDGPRQGIIGGRVAGVQRDRQIDRRVQGFVANLANTEFETRAAEFLRDSSAVGNHVGPPIETDNVDRPPVNMRQQVM
jgi:hypothetical protein